MYYDSMNHGYLAKVIPVTMHMQEVPYLPLVVEEFIRVMLEDQLKEVLLVEAPQAIIYLVEVMQDHPVEVAKAHTEKDHLVEETEVPPITDLKQAMQTCHWNNLHLNKN